MPKTLIIGYGNPLCGDDGVAWRVVEALEAILPVDSAAAVHQLTPEWAETISVVDRVIFVDAAVGPLPGEIRCFAIEPRSSILGSHELTSAGILAMAADLFGHRPVAHMVTITGGSFDISETLTLPVAAAVPGAVSVILDLIDAESAELSPAHSHGS